MPALLLDRRLDLELDRAVELLALGRDVLERAVERLLLDRADLDRRASCPPLIFATSASSTWPSKIMSSMFAIVATVVPGLKLFAWITE